MDFILLLWEIYLLQYIFFPSLFSPNLHVLFLFVLHSDFFKLNIFIRLSMLSSKISFLMTALYYCILLSECTMVSLVLHC